MAKGLNPAVLYKAADVLQKQIDAKRNPAIANQNLTARRARIADGMRREADGLERLQGTLCNVAAAAEAGTLPATLQCIRSKGHVEMLMRWSKLPSTDGWHAEVREKFVSMGIDTDEKFIEASRDLMAMVGKPKEKTPQQKIWEIERDLIGVQIPGFFPTPRPLANRLVLQAGIEPGMRVLEPSAGNGNIADAIRDAEPQAQLDVIEYQSRLCDILKLKGHRVVARDFLTDVPEQARYDRIVMNPPFENGQDIEHVQKAYGLLAPGGRLVAIMGEGAFCGSFKRCQNFREWLDELGVTGEKLPDGSFTGKDALRQTSVAARVVVIDKQYDYQEVQSCSINSLAVAS